MTKKSSKGTSSIKSDSAVPPQRPSSTVALDATEYATPLPIRAGNAPSSRPHILLAASGSVASIKFTLMATAMSEWAEVKCIATKAALHFIDKETLPAGVPLFTDEGEWTHWKKIGDEVQHIELRRWADILIIAPLSANTLAKIANGMCDNLLTCVVRAWDFSRPLLVAPAMNTFMWESVFTERHLAALQFLGCRVLPPVSKKLACGDIGTGAMADPSFVNSAARGAWEAVKAAKGHSIVLLSPSPFDENGLLKPNTLSLANSIDPLSEGALGRGGVGENGTGDGLGGMGQSDGAELAEVKLNVVSGVDGVVHVGEVLVKEDGRKRRRSAPAAPKKR